MIIGHLPIGYLTTKLAASKWKVSGGNIKFFMASGIIGSIAPDFDMLYFYLFDHRQHHHHTYWTHIPLFWVSMLVTLFISIRILDNKALTPIWAIFGTNVFLHLFADTIVGDIWWLSPMVDKPYALFTVPAIYHPWWLNFIFHWSFFVEILIFASAGYAWWNKKLFSIYSSP
jgi:inner membrane protein